MASVCSLWVQIISLRITSSRGWIVRGPASCWKTAGWHILMSYACGAGDSIRLTGFMICVTRWAWWYGRIWCSRAPITGSLTILLRASAERSRRMCAGSGITPPWAFGAATTKWNSLRLYANLKETISRLRIIWSKMNLLSRKSWKKRTRIHFIGLLLRPQAGALTALRIRIAAMSTSGTCGTPASRLPNIANIISGICLNLASSPFPA